MPLNLPPEPPAIIRNAQDVMEAEKESKEQRDKRKNDLEQGVDASNQPTTSGN
ncbi:hypothetical protein [Amycolatopsis lurida]|uniref:hypothetical protein n=1 Tax=Amycolatopsis lurida TaxID=31959 RepID=UPI00364B9DC8